MIRPDIEVEIFGEFDKSERALPEDERERLTIVLNNLVQRLRKFGWCPRFYKPRYAVFPEHVKRKNCSLYLFNATKDSTVILTFDDDPLFNQKVLGLFGIANNQNKVEIYNNIAQKLY